MICPCGKPLLDRTEFNQRRCYPCHSERRRLWKKTNPWSNHLSAARQRCTNPKERAYRRYGGRGVKFLLTVEQGAALWERDGADKLKRPSLDRIDPDGHYSFENCRFIELSENSRLSRGKWKRLTEQQVLEVLTSPLSGVALARKFGACPSTIHRIREGSTWKHLREAA